MRNLIDALRDHDLHMLQIIANRWDIDLDVRDVAQAAIHLADAMLMPDRAENEWERLKDRERGALQMLIAAQNHKMPLSQFTRLFGEIRQMGPDGRQREKPHLSPLDVGEILYYRGFLHLAVDESKTGMQTFVYVPHDLATVLPTHQAGYDLSETPEDFPDFEPIEDSGLEHVVESETPDHVRRADTSLVDDVTTLLAYAQMHPIRLERGWVPENVQQHILEQFLGPRDYSRLLMAFSLALDLKLLDEQEGVLQIQKNSARRWLEMLRTQQVSQLTQKWHITERYNELWQIPNLAPEETGWRNDPALLRQTLLETIRFFNNEGWIGLDQLIAEIREMDPDFQRPGGDYSSWYIRDRDTGDYLQGFEQWDRVEGATLRFAVEGPMYWLGLVDLGHSTPDGPVTSFRLTAFGRAWAGMTDWPELRDPEAHIHITADGEIAVPRAISRYERFQIIRFTDSGEPGDTYTYHLTSQSLKRASEQSITAEHIRAFLQRVTGEVLPEAVQSLLEYWGQSSGPGIILERLVVLQVDTPEMMQLVWETSEIRRFLGRKLGELAVVVRADQWEDLINGLEARGIPIDSRL